MATAVPTRLREPDRADYAPQSPLSDASDHSSEEAELIIEQPKEPAKDATEQELERILFGDASGFRDELSSFQQPRPNLSFLDQSQHYDQRRDLTTINDADLFFLDERPTKPSADALVPAEKPEHSLDARTRKSPAWEDSDDEAISVSLMSVPRLRKLRNYEGEDVVTGQEYTRRLRRQYEKLHPRPEWANWSQQHKKTKKRRRQSYDLDANSSQRELEQEDDDAMDIDPDPNDPSVRPLAKLLRNAKQLTRSSGALPTNSTSSASLTLRTEVIGLERMRDLTPSQPHAIISLSLHPTLPLLISSGLSGNLYLHRINLFSPNPNTPPSPLLTTLHLSNTPLTTSVFSPLRSPCDVAHNPSPSASSHHPKIYLSSPRRYYHTWTLPSGRIEKITSISGEQKTSQSGGLPVVKPSSCGRWLGVKGTSKKGGGVVNVLNADTSQWVAQARVEARKEGVADFAWWRDGNGLCCLSREGEVSEWSLRERRVVGRWIDEGQIGATVLALGGALDKNSKARQSQGEGEIVDIGSDKFIAVGSSSGVINIYSRVHILSSILDLPPDKPAQPTPHKTLSNNIVFPISHLVFNPSDPDGQLLVAASREKKNMLRLVHVPSGIVYRNWPTSRTPLGKVSSVALGEVVVNGRVGGRLIENGADNRKEGDEDRQETALCLFVGNESGSLRGWHITG